MKRQLPDGFPVPLRKEGVGLASSRIKGSEAAPRPQEGAAHCGWASHLPRHLRPSSPMRARASSRRLPFSTPEVTRGIGMSRWMR